SATGQPTLKVRLTRMFVTTRSVVFTSTVQGSPFASLATTEQLDIFPKALAQLLISYLVIFAVLPPSVVITARTSQFIPLHSPLTSVSKFSPPGRLSSMNLARLTPLCFHTAACARTGDASARQAMAAI